MMFCVKIKSKGMMSLSFPEEGITGLTDAQIRDNVSLAIAAANDTSACSLTWLLKFLAESPDDLQEIIAFLETNRLITPTFGVARKAINDAELNGTPLFHACKLIPKGWSVLLLFQPIHFNAKYYPDLCKFNPSRFNASPKPATYLAFGSGPRLCPGQDLAKTKTLVVLHRLVLGYRWELLGNSNGGKRFPTPVPKGDLPIAINLTDDGKVFG